jgi:aminoglycoside phosphotransferase family enzyme
MKNRLGVENKLHKMQVLKVIYPQKAGQTMRTTEMHYAVLGRAALSICESLLAAMLERGLLSDKDVGDLLEDAASMHREASKYADNPELHTMVAGIIEDIAAKKKLARGRSHVSSAPPT